MSASEAGAGAQPAADSTQRMDWALGQPLHAPEKIILTVLAWRANNPRREAWPSQARLAKDAGISVGAVKDGLARLEAVGLIERVASRRSNGQQSVNTYRLNLHVTVSDGQAKALRGVRAGSKPEPPGDSGATLSMGGGVPSPQPPGDLGRSHPVTAPEPPGDSDRSHRVATKEKLKDEDKESQGKEATAPAMVDLTDEELLRRDMACDYAGLTEEQSFRARQLYTQFMAKTIRPNRFGIHADHDHAPDHAGHQEPSMERETAVVPFVTYPDDNDPCWLAAETWPMKDDGYPMAPPPGCSASVSRVYEAAKALASDARYQALPPEEKARSDALMAALRASGGRITAKTFIGGAA